MTLEVARKHYDYYQPWSKPTRQVQKIGTVIADHQILTTADEMFDRTMVRLQKAGRGRWWEGEVAWIDYHANLALVTVSDPEFWVGLKPVALERTVPSDGNLQILRWREGNLESNGAEFSRYSVREGQLSQVNHVVLEAGSDIQGAGTGEPVVANSRLVGIVRAQEGRNCVVIPVAFINSILEAHKKGTYRGLGYFDFYWQRSENPATHELLKLTGKPRGVVVIDVPERLDGIEQVIRRRDIILQIDGFDVDTHGDYHDPEYGHLMLENLSTRGKWAGETVKMQVWREGKQIEIAYRLPKFEYTNSLVPAAIYDQEPEYLIAGGLVFQLLTDSFLQSWGAEWKHQAPFRLTYYDSEPPTKDRPALVFLAQVLPDDYNIGYQDQHGLVIDRVNGERIRRLTDLRSALEKPTNDFHVIDFAKGEALQRMVLAAGDAERDATKRVLQRYGIAESSHFASASAASAAAATSAATLPAPKRVHVPKLKGAVKIDGELNEPVWAKAAVLTPFFNNDGSGREREQTTTRIWYDDHALYLGWICKDTDIQATFTNRDSKFWEEEVVEFFVTPNVLSNYFELQWNPLGGVFDSTITNQLDEQGLSKNFVGDWSYTAKGMESAVQVKGTVNDSTDRDESWQVEVMIPFSDLGRPTPKKGEIWRANFYRYNRTKGQPVELLSWSPTRRPGFHEPSRFGFLEFGN